MSRSQGAANGGWPAQRQPGGETDSRPVARPQRPPQTPQYAQAPQQPPAYPQAPYPEQPAPAYGAQPGYHYPQQAPQYQPGPPSTPLTNRQGLSSLESARNAQPTHDFENFPPTQPGRFPQPQQRAPYAPQENPLGANPGYRQPQQPASQYATPSYEQWASGQSTADPFAQPDPGEYLAGNPVYAANSNQPYQDQLPQADWNLAAAGYADPALDPQQGYAHGQPVYGQVHGGALEPTYNHEEGAYEQEEPRRGSWTMRIAGAVVVAIGLGYGLAQAYKSVLGSPPDSAPPVVVSDSAPSKEKPLDPGGKQFPHSDSKVLGRLGDGGSQPQAADAGAASGALSQADADSNGARQVKTLVVGRDGSIAPPAASAEPAAAPEPEPSVSVPGLTVVDAFGGAGGPPPRGMGAQAPARQPEPPPAVVNTPPKSGMNVKSTRVVSSPPSTASIPDQQPAASPPPAAPKKQKMAAATPAGEEAPAAASTGGGNGFVVVLASVPASGTSRLDALRKFADMQQQYGSVLGSKTPDVRETNLAGKGLYHRLLVGPPGSRAQANEVCTQLKAYGYKDCWVTAY